MPDRPPRYHGERLYLRPFEPEDAELVHAWYADAETSRLMGQLPRSLARRRRDAEAATAEGADGFDFVLCLLADDRPIGRADIFELHGHDGSASFGLAIGDPDQRGQGLGREAVDLIVDFCFEQLRLERVWLRTDSDNERAQRLYERCGFVHEGRLRHAFYQDGRFQDEIRMAILRDEWEALPRRSGRPA